MTLLPTQRQLEILRWVASYIEKERMPPTIREIGHAFGLTSLRGVTVPLDALQRKGLIERTQLSRSIRILPAAAAFLPPCAEHQVIEAARQWRKTYGEWKEERDSTAANALALRLEREEHILCSAVDNYNRRKGGGL